MRSTHLKEALTGAATLLLVLTTASCANEGEDVSTPTIEPAPTGEVSDGGSESPSAGQTPDAEAEGDACKVQEGTETIPTEAPAVEAWEDVEGVPVPTSGEYGPYVRNGELWSCYEHSPTGAIFAATYLFAAIGNVEGATEAWFVDSLVKEQLLAQETPSDETAPATATPSAFRVISYTTDRAVVDVVMEIGSDAGVSYMSLRLPLVWSEDAWLVDGEAYIESAPTPLDSLDGYTRWSNDG